MINNVTSSTRLTIVYQADAVTHAVYSVTSFVQKPTARHLPLILSEIVPPAPLDFRRHYRLLFPQLRSLSSEYVSHSVLWALLDLEICQGYRLK